MPGFPGTFGAWVPPDGLRSIPGTSISWIAEHGSDAVALLLSQFQDKPRIAAMVRVLQAGTQELDDAIYQVLIDLWIDGAWGVQLDGIGVILDLPRAGWTDTAYKTLLRAQVLVLRSDGAWSDSIEIMRVLGVTLSLTRIDEPGIAAMRVVLGEFLDADVTADDVFLLLSNAHPAGVRFTLEYLTTDPEDSFTFADADAVQDDALRGFADNDGSGGGRLADAFATTEAA